MKNRDRLRPEEGKAYKDDNFPSKCDHDFTATVGCVVFNLE